MSISSPEHEATPPQAARTRPPWRARLAAAMTVALVASMLGLVTVAAPAAADTAPTRPGEPQTVSADRLPTVQINGVVWDQVIVGDRVYATGQFTQARPAGAAAGQNQTARSNILAYNINTGALITTWAPTLNAQGMAIAASADGSRIFVGGDFTQVSGTSRSRIAALDAQTGALISNFNPSANNRVGALAVNGNSLYVGGNFTTLGGQTRTRLAAVNATSGALQTWAPSVDRAIVTITVHPASGRVIAGGSFTVANGQPQLGMTSFDGVSGASPGALMPWAANQVVQNYGANTQISSLITDGQSIFGVGWAYFGAGGTTANFEGQFSADPLTGELKWINGCRGDQFSIAAQGDVLYTAGHSHDCGMIDYNPEVTPRVEHRGLAFDKRGSATGRYNAPGNPAEWRPFAGRPSTDPLYWLPLMAAGSYTGSFQAGYSVEANDNYVVYGGEFPRVNGVNQQGLVRFAKTTIAPNDEGPQEMNLAKPTLTATAPGIVKVNWIAPYDRDNSRLRYEVLRGSTVANSTVLSTFELDSTMWKRYPLGFLDLTAAPGTNQTYRIRVLDAFGNGGVSSATTVSVPAGTRPNSDYLNAVRASGATYHWRLDEATGTLVRDLAGSNDLTLFADAQRGVPGALLNESNTAVSFPASTNTNTVRGTTNFFESAPQVFSVEAWFRSTSTQGGKIVGFGGSNTSRSNSNLTDRHIYMTNTGELRFGLRPDMATRRTINSPAGFNDGQWHHVVGTLSGDGASLYVDGELVAQDATLNKGQVYYGYWRIGGDRLQQWPSAPTREAFEGTIDEVAVYPTALTAARVEANYLASGHTGAPNQPPVAAFTSSSTGLNASFDGTTSSDPGGSIATYSWNFGDGSLAGTGPTPTHTYTGGGNYTVTLTVTDNAGAVNSISQPVAITAPPPNQAPTAAFTFTTDQLTASFNGSGSSDPDPGGSIASYSWNFGDNSPAGSGATPSHTFPGTGNYEVTLTVTDVGGATNAVTQTVSVTGPNQPPVAAFTHTTDGLTVAVDGTTSTDPENAIASYVWDFAGDGSATAATASHTFDAAGTYPVTLTVTDGGGLTHSVTNPVTVTAPGVQPFAADLFTRTVSNGWGTADQGGAWTLSGTAANFSVSGDAGRIQAATSQQRTAYLTGAQSLDFDVAVDLSLNSAASGGGAYASVLARRNSTNNYGVKVRYQPNGSVLAYLVRTAGGTETTLAWTTVPGLTVAPNDVLRVRLQGIGSATTATSVKVWRATDLEPAAWLLTNTSAAPAALQVPGHIGVVLYLSSTWAGPAATLSVDNLAATDPE